jgi:Leucine-rich repeat (LRR) protein
LQGLEKEQFLLSLNPTGNITAQLVLHLAKEFATFSLKIDKSLLESIGTPDFDFGHLDYFDISKALKKEADLTGRASTLSYLFKEIRDLPPELLRLAELGGELPVERVELLRKEFKAFRSEKTITKNLKYKAEVIKTNEKEEWEVVDRVVRALVLADKQFVLRYRKYRHLDLSNLKRIAASEVGLTTLPVWLRDCHNLSELELYYNKIREVSQ